jgi:ankyrin repeat protein
MKRKKKQTAHYTWRRCCYATLLLVALLFAAGILSANAQDDDDDKSAVNFDKELERTTGLIVMIRADFNGVPEFGAGILFGRSTDRLLIATALHVIRRGARTAGRIQVTFRSAPETPVTATILSASDSTGLDLGFLSVPRTASLPVNPCTLAFDRLGFVADVERGDDVYPVGNPHGVAWAIPVSPDKVSQIVGKEIVFQSSFISIGHSGGGLVDANGKLVGMTTADEPPFGRGLDLRVILKNAKAHHLPVQLDTTLSGGGTPLHVAATQGDPEAVRRVLQDCGDPNAPDDRSATPLHFAAAKGNPDVLALLIKAGANINARDEDGDPPAEWAIEEGKLDALQLLVKAGTPLNQKNKKGQTLVELAVKDKQTALASYLISAGALLNPGDKGRGADPLREAAGNNDLPMVKRLMAAGAKADVHMLWQPTHDKNYELMQLLLPGISDLNGIMGYGDDTPLEWAIAGNDLKLATMLLDAGANVNDMSRSTSPLVWTFNREDSVMQRLLVSRGGVIKTTDSSNIFYEMDQAVEHGEMTSVQLFLDPKVNPYASGVRARLNRDLRIAITNGRQEIVRLLLQKGADPNGKDNESTPLSAAVDARDSALTKMLMDAGATSTNRQLEDAIDKGDIGLLHLLLKRSVDIDPDLLTRMIEHGDLPALEALLQSKMAHPNLDGLLAKATEVNNPGIVQYLMKRGARPTAGWKKAIADGDVDIVRQFIKSGMDVNQPLDKGETPLHLAAAENRTAVVELLLQSGAQPNARRKDTYTPLREAVGSGNIQIVELLLQAGVSIEDTSTDQDTPLLLALTWEKNGLARYLIQHRANVNAKGAWRKSPLHYAVKMDTALVKMLLDRNANPRTIDDDGNTPLHVLAGSDAEQPIASMRMLLAAGAAINAKNKNGETPLKLALDANNQPVANYLKEHGAK